MLNLPHDTKQLRGSPFLGSRSIHLTVVIKKPLQSLGIPTAIRLIRPHHQQREMLLLGIVPCKVRMDALRNLTKQRLQIRWRIELLCLMSIAERSIVSLLCTLTSLHGATPGSFRIIEIDLTFSNPRLQLV